MVAPQYRTLWMHAAVSMVHRKVAGRSCFRGLRTVFSPPRHCNVDRMETPKVFAMFCNSFVFTCLPPARDRMASLTSLGKSECCCRNLLSCVRSTTSGAAMRCSASAAEGTDSCAGCLAMSKVAGRPFSYEMASRKCLRTASRSSSIVA